MSMNNIKEKMTKNDLTLMSWNVQGGLKDAIKRDLILEKMERTEASIFLLQEPGRLDMRQLQLIKMEIVRILGKIKIIYEKDDSVYGGVMIIVRGNWVHRYDSHIIDIKKMNRYHALRFRGIQGQTVSIINLYRPHFGSTGTQSVVEVIRGRYLEKHELDDKEPEQLWDEDFQQLIRSEKQNSEYIVVAGDFNLRRHKQANTWQILQDNRMRNILEEKYGLSIPPTRHPGESSAIDHIFASENLRFQRIEIMEFTEMSDHAPIQATIFGNDIFYTIVPKHTIELRKVQSHNPVAVKKFREYMEHNLSKYEILKRLKRLELEYDEISQDSRGHDNRNMKRIEQEFNQIVTTVDEITVEAEKEAAKDIKGTRILSKEERRIRKEILVYRKWRAWILSPEKTKWSKANIKRMVASIGLHESQVSQLTLQDIGQRLKVAWERWKDLIDAKYRRKQEWRYYEEAKGRQSLGDSREVEAIIKSLKNMQESKRTHSRIKGARNRNKENSVTFIELERSEGDRIQIYNKPEMEEAIIAACYQKVHTADNTPLWKDPLATYIGITKSPAEWESLFTTAFFRRKEFMNMQLSEGTKLFLEKISIQEEGEQLEFTDDQYWKGWKKQKEKTASQGIINFSHFMCVESDSQANHCRARISQLRMKTGITPKAYKQSTDLLLLKKKNEYRPEKMRLITLQHAAGNHDFKLIGRHLNTLGEKHGLFAEGQYGSRNHKAANMQALNKSLLIDISRLQKRTLIMVANDAKSCYDRVVLWALYFVMRKFRISREIAQTTVEVLNEMTHNISTAHGVSEKCYGGKDTFPNGMCQGNGAAAQAWAAISSILLTICQEQGYGADIISAINKEIGTIVGFAFVDDTDLADMAKKGEDDEKLVKRIQKCLTLWNELIETTGGALEPEKTDWSIIAYEKHFGLWVPQPRKQFTLHLVDEHTRERKAIRLLEPQEARRTLGIWQAMDGNQEKQLEIMVENIRTYGEQIKLSGLSKSEKAIALQSTITRTIAYAGMATTLSNKQTETINRELRKATIQGLGLDRSTPVVLLHGPKAKNGLGIMDYGVFQLTEHIKVLLDHMEADTITGKLIRNLIELHTLEIGMDGTIWEHKEERIYTMMTQSWVKNTVLEMRKHNIRLESQRSPTLKKWRIGDRFIMDMIISSPGNRFTTMELRGIQEVRRFLKVNTLSDILVNGVIRENIWQATTAEDSTSKFQYEWMHSEPPSQEEILMWQQALIKIGIQGPNIRISNTLGSWFRDSIIYDAWINEEENRIYIRSEETYEVFAKQEGDIGRNQRAKFIKCNESGNERYIQQHQRIRIMKEGEQVYFISKIISIVQRHRSRREVYWTETKSSGSVFEMNRFIQKIEKGTATLVTDASDDKSGKLACAFYEELPLEQEDEINNVHGYSQIPSTLEDTNSFRGELGGILQALRFVTKLEKEMKLSKGGCTIICDNEKAIEIVAELLEKPYPSSRTANFDILRMLYTELQNTILKIVFKWVRGHQDRNRQYEELDNDARANFRADRLAAETICTMSRKCDHIPDSYEGPYLSIAGVKVYNDIYGKINKQVNGKPLTQYWINKGRFNGGDSEVDWQALAWAMNKFSFSDQIILMKLLSNRAPTATVMHRRQQYNDSRCPLCRRTDEDEHHIYRCEDIEAHDFKQTQVEQLRSTLQRNGLLQGRLVRQIVEWLKTYLS